MCESHTLLRHSFAPRFSAQARGCDMAKTQQPPLFDEERTERHVSWSFLTEERGAALVSELAIMADEVMSSMLISFF
jgi:hypothetical protein